MPLTDASVQHATNYCRRMADKIGNNRGHSIDHPHIHMAVQFDYKNAKTFDEMKTWLADNGWANANFEPMASTFDAMVAYTQKTGSVWCSYGEM